MDVAFKDFDNFLRDMKDLEELQCWAPRIPTFIEPEPIKRKRRKIRFNPLADMADKDFITKYRFCKNNMRRIIEIVRDDLESDNHCTETHDSNQVPVDLQIMAAIRYWGMSEHPETTAKAHSVTSRTLAKICRRVSAALASNASRYIRMPATLAEKELVTNAFQSLAGMPQVVGALAHSSVRLRRNDAFEKEIHLTMDAGEELMHIQVVSDASFKIRDLDCRLRSTKDGNYAGEIFAQSRIKERFEQNEFRGRVLLGSDHLSCTPFLFTPVQCPANNEELAFNQSHAETFAPVAKCLNSWMRRFGILGSELHASPNTAKHTIVALALLHNMAIEWKDQSLECYSNGLSNGDNFINNHALWPPTIISRQEIAESHARVEFIKNNFKNV